MVTDADASVDWPAPAKLNLFLHITGRRPDGYHTLQTVFRLLDYGDIMDFGVTADGRVARHAPIPGVVEEQDLVVRAARLLQRETGCGRGVRIRLRKRLPLGGGLGGGSSNAATTLVALNRLWRTGLDEDALAALGATLGADVPVFIRGRSAWAEGVGERLTALELPPEWYVVLVPDCGVSTAEVFAAPELTRDTPPLKMAAFRPGVGRNDCEYVVKQRYPRVARALAALAETGEARMTGTGACVFAAFPERCDAQRALERCRLAGWDGFVARGLNRSPLFDRLSEEA